MITTQRITQLSEMLAVHDPRQDYDARVVSIAELKELVRGYRSAPRVPFPALPINAEDERLILLGSTWRWHLDPGSSVGELRTVSVVDSTQIVTLKPDGKLAGEWRGNPVHGLSPEEDFRENHQWVSDPVPGYNHGVTAVRRVDSSKPEERSPRDAALDAIEKRYEHEPETGERDAFREALNYAYNAGMTAVRRVDSSKDYPASTAEPALPTREHREVAAKLFCGDRDWRLYAGIAAWVATGVERQGESMGFALTRIAEYVASKDSPAGSAPEHCGTVWCQRLKDHSGACMSHPPNGERSIDECRAEYFAPTTGKVADSLPVWQRTAEVWLPALDACLSDSRESRLAILRMAFDRVAGVAEADIENRFQTELRSMQRIHEALVTQKAELKERAEKAEASLERAEARAAELQQQLETEDALAVKVREEDLDKIGRLETRVSELDATVETQRIDLLAADAAGKFLDAEMKKRREKIAELTEKLATYEREAKALAEAYHRYRRNDLSREEIEGYIAERAELAKSGEVKS